MPEDSNVTGPTGEWPGPPDEWPQFGEGVAAAMRRSGFPGHPLMMPEELRTRSGWEPTPVPKVQAGGFEFGVITAEDLPPGAVALVDKQGRIVTVPVDPAMPAPADAGIPADADSVVVARADWERALELLHVVTTANDPCDLAHDGECQAHPFGLSDDEGREQCLVPEVLRLFERVGVKPYPEDFEVPR